MRINDYVPTLTLNRAWLYKEVPHFNGNIKNAFKYMRKINKDVLHLSLEYQKDNVALITIYEDDVFDIVITENNYAYAKQHLKDSLICQEYLFNMVKSMGLEVNGKRISWEIDKKLANNLGISKLLKSLNREGNMESQKKYEHLIKATHAFTLKALTMLDQKDSLSQKTHSFIDETIKVVDFSESANLEKFVADITKKLNKIVKVPTKTNVSKILQFLENCPDECVKYRL